MEKGRKKNLKKEKKERGRRELCGMWNVLECGGSGREKMGKREKKKREGYVCGGEKKRGKKKKEIWMKKNKGKIK